MVLFLFDLCEAEAVGGDSCVGLAFLPGQGISPSAFPLMHQYLFTCQNNWPHYMDHFPTPECKYSNGMCVVTAEVTAEGPWLLQPC